MDFVTLKTSDASRHSEMLGNRIQRPRAATPAFETNNFEEYVTNNVSHKVGCCNRSIDLKKCFLDGTLSPDRGFIVFGSLMNLESSATACRKQDISSSLGSLFYSNSPELKAEASSLHHTQ